MILDSDADLFPLSKVARECLRTLLSDAAKFSRGNRISTCAHFARSVWLESAGRDPELSSESLRLLSVCNDNVAKTLEVYETCASEYTRALSTTSYPLVESRRTEFLSSIPPGLIVDVGAGTGRDSVFFSSTGRSVLAIEPCLTFARTLRKQAPLNLRVLPSDMRALPLANSAVAGIWCCSAAHHISKSEFAGMLCSFDRMLVPDGLLMLSVRSGTGEEMRQGRTIKQPRFYSNYEESELEYYLDAAGFGDIDISRERSERDGEWLFARASAQTRQTICRLCEVTNRRRLMLDNHEPSREQLFGPPPIVTDYNVVVPDGAPICSGHSLVIGRQHSRGYALMQHSAREDLCDVLRKISSPETEGTFGDGLWFFEHGTGSEHRGVACEEHAHVHVVPTSADLYSHFVRAFPNARIYPTTNAAWDSVGLTSNYYLMGRVNGDVLVVDDAPWTSQILRQIVASAIGAPARWNARSVVKDPDVAIYEDIYKTWSALIHVASTKD